MNARRTRVARTFVISAFVATGVLAGSARDARTEPVPASFASKVSGVCRDLKSSLPSAFPPDVQKAVDKIPGHATKAEVRLFGNYLAAHEDPAYQRASVRLKALGQPATGRAAWSQFLSAFQSWVVANKAMTRQLQKGNDRIYNGADYDRRENAFHRAKTSALRAGAGTTNCLAVIG